MLFFSSHLDATHYRQFSTLKTRLVVCWNKPLPHDRIFDSPRKLRVFRTTEKLHRNRITPFINLNGERDLRCCSERVAIFRRNVQTFAFCLDRPSTDVRPLRFVPSIQNRIDEVTNSVVVRLFSFRS